MHIMFNAFLLLLREAISQGNCSPSVFPYAFAQSMKERRQLGSWCGKRWIFVFPPPWTSYRFVCMPPHPHTHPKKDEKLPLVPIDTLFSGQIQTVESALSSSITALVVLEDGICIEAMETGSTKAHLLPKMLLIQTAVVGKGQAGNKNP